MKTVSLPMAELAVIAATRGMLGAGAALLLSDRVPPRRRRALGWTLFLAGAATTVPLAQDIVGKWLGADEPKQPEAEEEPAVVS